MDPAFCRLRNLKDVCQAQACHLVAKPWLPPITLISRHKRPRNPVSHGTLELAKRYRAFAFVDNCVRNTSLFAALLDSRVSWIGIPALRQEQLAVDERVEILSDVGEMNSDNTIVDLSALTTILTV